MGISMEVETEKTEELANTDGLMRYYQVVKSDTCTRNFTFYYKRKEGKDVSLNFKDLLEIFRVQSKDSFLEAPVTTNGRLDSGPIQVVLFFERYDTEGNLIEHKVSLSGDDK